MAKMFDLQRKFQKKLGNDVQSQVFRTEHSLALIVETSEFLQETPWKSWKQSGALHEARAKEELIDMWHFMINLSLSMGMSASDVYQAFLSKHKVNINRQARGY